MIVRPACRIATFYSYKGGTGRSMALANFAWIVAASGKRVLAIDWDLEAPGLHRYFRPFLIDPDLFETDGLIDAFWTLASSALARTPEGAGDAHAGSGDEAGEALADVTRRLDWEFAAGGYIDFIAAGRQGTTYSERINSFDWRRFYELGGAAMLTGAKADLRQRYDWILIDSRTGVSDTSGICTMQMPDLLVACFTLNRQNIEGVTAVLQSIRAFRSSSVDGSEIEIFPLATRIENAEQARLEQARGFARPALAEFLPRGMRTSPRDYWDKMEISYRPAYAFEEVLAAFGDATGASGAADTMLTQVEAMAQCVTGDASLRMPEIVDRDRDRVLARYALGPGRAAAGTAAAKAASEEDDHGADFIRGLLAKEQLWRTSGFRFSWLLSRRELDLLTDRDRAEFGRNMAYYWAESKRMRDFIRRAMLFGSTAWSSMVLLFFAEMLLTFVVPHDAQFFKDPIGRLFRDSSDFLPPILAVSWLLAAFMIAGPWGHDRPYGLRFSEALYFLLAGPAMPTIRDFPLRTRERTGKPAGD